ncbi:MAG: hypothetical protein GSR84_04480 [Desulfurococcales archaeon]|nr:hypothetical protein [Desulfurococcales archaeon]
MSIVEYKETIDYTWVISRQLDRVADAYSSIDYEVPGPGIRRMYMAVRGLWLLTQIYLGDEAKKLLAEASAAISDGRNIEALRKIEDVVGLILAKLDNMGLLVRYKRLMGVVEE